MASTSTLKALTSIIRDIGRGVVFYSVGAYGGTGTDLTLVHLGDTEGEIKIDPNPEYQALTTPELTGPIPHEKYLQGIAPTLTIPLFSADPLLDAIVTPTVQATGSQGGGFDRRQAVTEYALVIFPEALFIESAIAVAVEYTTAADWKVGADIATAAQLAILDKAIFFWRGHFDPMVPKYTHEDGGKEIQEVTFHAMHNESMQQGHYIYTKGRPDQAATPIEISTT